MTYAFRRFAVAALALAITGLFPVPAAHAADQAPAVQAEQAAKVDLNSATVDQLTELPGIGAALAQRIVDYREQVGSFGSVEELMNVKGIGEKSFAKLSPRLTVRSKTRSDASR